MHSRRSTLIHAAAILVLGGCAIGPIDQPVRGVATVMEASGRVVATRPGGLPRLLEAGSSIQDGDRIEVDSMSSVVLQMDSGLLLLREGSDVTISVVRSRGAGDEYVVIELSKGVLRYVTRAANQLLQPRRPEFSSLGVTVGIRGTDLDLARYREESVLAGLAIRTGLYLQLNEGSAELSSPNGGQRQSLAVAAGQQASVTAERLITRGGEVIEVQALRVLESRVPNLFPRGDVDGNLRRAPGR